MAGEKRKQEKAPEKVPTKEELEMQSRVQQYNVSLRESEKKIHIKCETIFSHRKSYLFPRQSLSNFLFGN